MTSPRIGVEVVDEIAAPDDEYALLTQGGELFAYFKME